MDSNTNAQATEPQGCETVAATEQHKWLQQLVGEWTIESSMKMPDGSDAESTGKEKGHALGELWIIAKLRSGMPGGGEMDGRFQLGYNVGRGTFTGSFIANMMDFMWVYESGELSADKKTLTLNCVGPDMSPGAAPGSTANYRDVIELTDNDHRVLRSFGEFKEGEWMQFMEARYTRAE
ncbi:MAG: DUF1579 domain-containing protein [bacterium]|nr:DUF1579 domain-containing protein [bacterium]